MPACSHFVTLFCLAFALTSYNIRHHAPSLFVPFPFLGPSEPCLCSDLLGGRCWELLLTCRSFALPCGPGGLPGWALPPGWLGGLFPFPSRLGSTRCHMMYVLARICILQAVAIRSHFHNTRGLGVHLASQSWFHRSLEKGSNSTLPNTIKMGRKVAKHSEETRGVRTKKGRKHKTRSYSTSQIQVALQRLRDRATAASTHNQQEAARGHAPEIRDNTTQHPQPHQLSSFQISKQIALFGRYPELRPGGLLTDTEDRISFNSLMTTWGVPKGLSTIQIREALQQHAASRRRQRFTITTNHDDTMIAVSKPSPRHNTPRGKWRSSPSSPCRRAR